MGSYHRQRTQRQRGAEKRHKSTSGERQDSRCESRERRSSKEGKSKLTPGLTHRKLYIKALL